RLLDKAGVPVRGALSLAAVDEAVFSVLEQAPGAEARFFTDEPAFLRETRGIDLPKPERERFEQAQLAPTARAGSARGSGRGPARKPAPGVVVSAEPVMLSHSLDASSFISKSQSVARVRDLGLDRVMVFWTLWGLAVVMTVYVLMWVYVRPWYVVAILHIAS